jgi:hypothetical protein
MDWVNTNCKFTEREKELLQLVYDRKLVRRDHLEIISPSYRNIHDSNVRRVLICRAIKKMYQKMCLDKTHEPQEIGKGSNPSIVSIDKGGSILLGVPHKQRISHIKNTVNGSEYITRKLPANYRHINGVNQLEVETILLCEEACNEIVQWKHEVGKQFYHGEEKIHLIPDVFMEIKLKKKPLLAFIEYDTGSENIRYREPPIIRDKVMKYRKYKMSKLWVDDGLPYFPVILFVTEDEKRIKFFKEKCRESRLEGYGVYHEKYAKLLRHLFSFG